MISIDYQDKRPLYEQIVEKMQHLIVKGIIGQDEKLPSVRALAIELSINPNTIQRAYAELESGGFIYTVKGRGNFASGKDKWIADEKADVISNMTQDVKKAFALGIDKSELISVIDTIYLGKEGRND